MVFFTTILFLFSYTISNFSCSSVNDTNASLDFTGAAGFKHVIKPKFPLRILLTNDDSWASANIRSTYYALKTAGHKVLMVAPVVNQSGKGGTAVLPTVASLTAPGRDDSVPAGAPYYGTELYDKAITYVNASPAASVLFGLDQIVPTFEEFKGEQPQLIISGPNESTNLGPFIFTLSGTVGASYTAVKRGIPGIAFSASTEPRDWKDVNFTDPNDEGVILGTQSANFVSALTYTLKVNSSSSNPIFPFGIGANVNFAQNVNNTKLCPHTIWYLTRLTGGAYVYKVLIDQNSNLPIFQENFTSLGLNQCLNGDCSLPGEQNIINKDLCSATVSIYSVDMDAPNHHILQTKPAFHNAILGLNSWMIKRTNDTLPGKPEESKMMM